MYTSAETVLIPIHPKFVEKIFDKKKRIEFRKFEFKQNVNKVLIYSTWPKSKIVGYFEIAKIEKLTPDKMWNKYSIIGGIEQVDFIEYYKNKKIALGILIKKVYKFEEEIDLHSVNLTTPQSFQYINENIFKNICERGKLLI